MNKKSIIKPSKEPKKSKAISDAKTEPQPVKEILLSKADYEAQLHVLQVEFVKLQHHLIASGGKILLLLEGRDASGKDGSIKRIVEYLSPRETRVVALGKPSDHEKTAWYFQRYVAELPKAEEFVLFNRSWYNRAGVEPVMGYCSKAEYEDFMHNVSGFEYLLASSGIKLLKYYLDISQSEQESRLADRARDPLKQWKYSPVDAVAVKHWAEYSEARNQMLERTDSQHAPWTVIHTDNKRLARLNLMRDILLRLDYRGKKHHLVHPDSSVVFKFTPEFLQQNILAN